MVYLSYNFLYLKRNEKIGVRSTKFKHEKVKEVLYYRFEEAYKM